MCKHFHTPYSDDATLGNGPPYRHLFNRVVLRMRQNKPRFCMNCTKTVSPEQRPEMCNSYIVNGCLPIGKLFREECT